MSDNGEEIVNLITVNRVGKNIKVSFGNNLSFSELSLAMRLASYQLDNLLMSGQVQRKPPVIIPQVVVPQKELDRIRNRFNA